MVADHAQIFRPIKDPPMTILRTPDDRFDNLSGYPFAPHYVEVDGLRLHSVDEGPRDAEPVLMLHGEPTWSFLYRHMIPVITAAGFRAVAPDLPGFGKSDKLAERSGYSYQKLVDWLAAWLEIMDLRQITLVCQDWGALIGLRLAMENEARFARIVLSNGGLVTGDQTMPEAFYTWQTFSQQVSKLPIGRIIQGGTVTQLTADVLRGYQAPFPDETYKEAARILPALVPTTPNDPATRPNRKALLKLRQWEKPFLTAFSDGDPITRGGDKLFQAHVPGAQGQPHTTISGAGHFLQEDKGPELAQVVVDFMQRNPLPPA